MAIVTSAVVTRMEAGLDSEGSDRYLFNEDFRPAIHYAIQWIQTALTDLFAQKRFSPEALTELTKTRVWQTNAYSRFSYNSADLNGEDYWTILTVHPKPTCQPNGPVLVLPADQSKVRTDLVYLRSDFSARRQSYEESSINRDNPFAAGNTIVNNALTTYAVLDASNYTATGYAPAGTYEWEIIPAVPKELIGVRYLKKPNLPAADTDVIEFRDTAMNILVDRALQYISWKQGDGTNLYGVSERDYQQLIQIFGR